MDQVKEKVYEELKCKITVNSYKALKVEFRNGRHVWIPNVCIQNYDQLNTYDFDNEQVLLVEYTFCKKYELIDNGWY